MLKICRICGKSKEMLSFENTCNACLKEQELKQIQSDIQSGKENVDTFSSDYVICPYCGYAHPTDYGYEDFPELYEDGEHSIECFNCEKTFVLTTMVSYSWKTEKENE